MPFMIKAESVELEAHLRQPQGDPLGAVVFCHPHPVYGGTMDNTVIYQTSKAAAETGFAALRFNFRGVGQSTGQYDQGLGEQEDAAAAVRWLGEKYPSLPLGLAGYSFGAWVGLRVGCSEPLVRALIGLAVPLDLYDFEFLIANSKPARYIVGTEDEFCSLENLDRWERRLPVSSSLHRIEGADHFFTGHVPHVRNLVAEFFNRLQTDRDIL
jgi:alpha/beta superfamily hydrolase